MKQIIYDMLQGIDENNNPILSSVTIGYSEKNLIIAENEAYNGDYEIIDDGKPAPAVQPTQADIIEAQVMYTAMMTDTLLEGGNM